ncbi:MULTISPECIES: 3-oxoacyl-ACP reductase FabG [unclassified Nocardia]|uniref:3-oxoacyl-ACP reductase FabG n=1 Tax=unclassified Nocardia TaxID=2637762 RepID=UPI0035DC080E
MSDPTQDSRVAVVTGGGSGIGAAISTRLARDGIAVAILDRDENAAGATAAAIERAGGTALAVVADVADECAVDTSIARIADRLGPPTVLVNNAGITRDHLLFKMTVQDWDAVIGVHLRGAFLLSRAVQSHMVDARWGRIVNLSSISALGNRGQANYAAAKAGLQGFTKTLAIELGRFGVTVNTVAPGYVETPMTAAMADRLGITFQELEAELAQHVPIGRIGQPDDIAAAVAFFVRADSGFVSGQTLYVAGGPVN